MSNFESGPVKLKDGDVRWEDAAEQVTISGWSCKHCHRFYGDDERAARYCCHTDAPCDCGKRKSRHRTMCDDCWHAEKIRRWEASEQVQCSEPTEDNPWSLFDDDKYFFDVESFLEHCDEHEVKPSEVFPVLCRQHKPGSFFLSEWLADYSFEDECPVDGVDLKIADEAVNAVLDRVERWPWYPDKKRRPSDADLARLDAEYAKDNGGAK